MPKFKVTLRRHVNKLDEFERIVEADDDTDAHNLGNEIANEADSSCPDDCYEADFLELGDFYVEDVEQVDEDEEIDQ